MQKLLTLEEVSEQLRVSVATLRFWRSKGDYGPPSVRLGRRIAYRADDVDNWLTDQFNGAK